MIDRHSDNEIRDLLSTVTRVAVVGASASEEKPAYFVPAVMQNEGYEILPINPGQAGKEILGQKVYASLADVEGRIDMVDVFRRPDHVEGVVDEILALPEKPKVIWLQIGVYNEAAVKKAEAAGITVVTERCPKVEIPRLSPTTPSRR
jgi:uncharacterized protein